MELLSINNIHYNFFIFIYIFVLSMTVKALLTNNFFAEHHFNKSDQLFYCNVVKFDLHINILLRKNPFWLWY